MAYVPFVTIEDLIIFLEAHGIGVTLSALQQRSFERRYNALVSGACQEWERVTGYTPFVVANDSSGLPVLSTRQYTQIDNGMLDLRTGIVGQPSAVKTLDQAGNILSTLTFHPQYCWPQNADSEGKPFTYFKFSESTGIASYDYTRRQYSESLAGYMPGMCTYLEVTAYFGYCKSDNIPALAKNAVLGRACQEPAMASALSSVLANGARTSMQVDDVKETWNPEMLLKALRSMPIDFERTAMLFKRARIC